MDNHALISVIIPVYNVEQYLCECVDSVINQTYKNLEIILVDDGSTDSSGKICDDYAHKDERISVIHQKNSGLSGARNTGIDNASGDYIYFLDSDDYIDPNALESLIVIAEKNSSDIVFFDAISFADTKDFTVKQNYIRKNKYLTDSGRNVFCMMTQKKEFHSSVPLMLLNKAFAQKNQLRFVPEILHEDMIFTYQAIVLAKSVSQCDKALYHRRCRKNSIMTSAKSKKHFLSCIDVCKANNDFTLSLFGTDIPVECYQYLVRCASNVFNVYEKLSKADRIECRNNLEIFKQYVIDNNAFFDTALKMRCYGKAFWFAYKLFDKTVGRLLKGKK